MQPTSVHYLVFAGLLVLSTSCGDTTPNAATPDTVRATMVTTNDLPEEMEKILDAHGGLERWKEHRTLSYAMPKGEDAETQTVDLYDRREYISQPAAGGEDPIEMGFDGKDIWVTADTTYKGNPVFYKNLMFYFYAMPWVLADPGIRYSETEPLTFNGQTYPGIMISYDDGIGYSPKDNYRLHYDPKSGKMRWLGYTVTGRSGKVSEKFSWIEYPTWSDHDGVELADSLVWYTTENNLPVSPRNTRVFNEVEISKKPADNARFARPAGARIVGE